MYLKEELSCVVIIIIKKYMIHCYHSFTDSLTLLLNVILFKVLSALTRDYEMPVSAKILGGLL